MPHSVPLDQPVFGQYIEGGQLRGSERSLGGGAGGGGGAGDCRGRGRTSEQTGGGGLREQIYMEGISRDTEQDLI